MILSDDVPCPARPVILPSRFTLLSQQLDSLRLPMLPFFVPFYFFKTHVTLSVIRWKRVFRFEFRGGLVACQLTRSLFCRTNVNTVWRRRTCLMNYDVQQTLKSDNDCVPPRQYLWPFDALGCPPSATERFLSRPPVCGTVFHRMSPLLHPSPFFILVLNPICFLFLILISDSLHFSLVQCLRSDFVISDTIIVITLDIRH